MIWNGSYQKLTGSFEGSLQDLIADEEDAADAVRIFDEKVNEAMAAFRTATGQPQP